MLEQLGLSTLSAGEIVDLVVRDGLPLLGQLLKAILILVFTWLGARWADRALGASISRLGVDGTVSSFISTVTRWLIVLVGLLFCLSNFGIQTTSIAAVLGGAGVAIALALQGDLSNVSSGLLLMVIRPFRAGEWVTINGHEGRVEAVQIFTTRLNTFDNRQIIFPNRTVLDSPLANHSANGIIRVDLPAGVAYDADLRVAISVLTTALEGIEGRQAERPVLVRLTELGDSSINFKLGVWADPDDLFDIRHRMILAVKDALDEAGIGIPFPQMDVHLDGGLARPASDD